MNTFQKIAAGLGLAAVANQTRRHLMHEIDLQGRAVAITGGSRGLGLELARAFADDGARLALLARDEAELRRASTDVATHGAEVIAVPCDVRERQSVQDAIARVADHYGAVDVLVNDAGVIQVGPLDHMTVDDFQEAMAVHAWGPLYAMLAVVPYMRRQGGGRIVNISSIGGKVAVPHLAPYSASKFALVGLSDALRAELARDDILVTTVCPGLMRTGSPINAQFKGRHREEYTWFAIGDALPGLSIDSARAARQIVAACRAGDPELTITLAARAAVLANALFPDTTARVMTVVNRLLPGPAPADGNRARPGRESQTPLTQSSLTGLSDKAAAANNEQPARVGSRG